jgi:hypothetical protein
VKKEAARAVERLRNSEAPGKAEASYTVAQLQEFLGTSSNTTNKYIKDAGVVPASPGKKNKTFTHGEVVRVLEHAKRYASTKITREMAAEALLKISKKAQ